MSDRFEERRNEFIADGKEVFVDQAVFYNAKMCSFFPVIRTIKVCFGDFYRVCRNISHKTML